MTARSVVSAVLLLCVVLFSGVEIGTVLNMPRLDEILSGGGIAGSLLAFYLQGREG